ncbi:MAG: serine/threonine-protein phosphatase [Spirochaetales bacterium]|nr:serine/threonine-protein phosphatase [Spirochaetales bacterium]
MELDDLLKRDRPPGKGAWSPTMDDFEKLFWKCKGLIKERERNVAFWKSTNENLSMAYDKLDDQERELEKAYGIITDDLKVANRIQSSLLPSLNGQMQDELEFAVYHKQLAEVGGDYYDFFKTKNGGYAIGVFDISGHGVAAALVMAYLKAQFTLAINLFDSPKSIVEYVNSQSVGFLRNVKKYATLNFVLFNNDRVNYVCGGGNGLLVHDYTPILFKKQDYFLGLKQRTYNEYTLPFVEGDLLVLYTDGITEAQNGNFEDYSIRRLNALIVANANREVTEILDAAIGDFRRFCRRQQDDITLIILRKRRRS